MVTEAGQQEIAPVGKSPDTPSNGTPPAAEPEVKQAAPAEQQGDELAMLRQQVKLYEKRLESRKRSADPAITEVQRLIKRLSARVDVLMDDSLDGESRKTKVTQADAAQDVADRALKRVAERSERMATLIDRKVARAGLEWSDQRLASLAEKWLESKSIEDLEDVYDEIDDLVTNATEQRAATEAKARDAAAKAAAQAGKREGLQEAGALDMETGGSGGGGAITMDNIDALMANIRNESPARRAEIMSKYRRLMQTGRLE